jgi:glycosyltransferase involved in cell wall biosynthesis
MLPVAKVLVMDGYAGAFSNFRAQLLRDLVAAGHSVVACAPDISQELRAALASQGVETRSIEIDRKGTNVVRDFLSWCKMVRTMRAVRPDFVLLYSSKPIMYGTVAAFVAGVPTRACFITGLGFGFAADSFRARVIGLIQRVLYWVGLRFCSVIFFQNPDDRQVFLSRRLVPRGVNIRLISGSGVDTSMFPCSPIPEGPAHFLMIGRLLKSKGVLEYVAAAARLKSTFGVATCSLVGWIDSDNPDSLDADELSKLLVESKVEFLGRLDDVRPALRACTVFVLPSYREGTPRSTLEALSTGRAVITTDAPGCRETVMPGLNGLLVPVGDVEALYAAMAALASDFAKVQQFGAESRRLAESRFDVHEVNKAILDALGLTAAVTKRGGW